MLTLGVDLAAADARTGAATVEWAGERGQLVDLVQPASDELIAEIARACDAIAIDAPLGWPVAFTDAMIGHRHGGPWPEVASAELRLRLTDRRLGAEGIWPLSVSTDRIGIVAFRAARLLPKLGKGLHPARDGTDAIFEVYPAAALARWRRQFRQYKQLIPAHEQGRRDILAWLTERFVLDLAGEDERLIGSSDLLDALICAILGREALEGRTAPIAAVDRAIAREEGWIHLPAPVSEGGQSQ